MIPVTQTVLHDPQNGINGNCFSAVLASLLHLDIQAVPVFSNEETWQQDLNRWLRGYNLAYIQIGNLDAHIPQLQIEGLHHEMGGNTQRHQETLHATVAIDGHLAFDPHPSRAGLTNKKAFGVFLALKPWLMQRDETPKANA